MMAATAAFFAEIRMDKFFSCKSSTRSRPLGETRVGSAHPIKSEGVGAVLTAVIMLAIVQLNQGTIIDAAISILNSYGLADMTMRRVAKQLEVAPGALYWHFKNKQELIGATARRILEPLLTQGGEEGVDKLDATTTCAQLRALMISHRDGAEVVSAALSDATLHDELETLIAASLPTQEGVGAFTLLHFVIGAVLAEQTQRQLKELTGGDHTLVSGDFEAFEERFLTGIRIIITGLDALGRIR